jgi:hypothetical protein
MISLFSFCGRLSCSFCNSMVLYWLYTTVLSYATLVISAWIASLVVGAGGGGATLVSCYIKRGSPIFLYCLWPSKPSKQELLMYNEPYSYRLIIQWILQGINLYYIKFMLADRLINYKQYIL